MARKKQAPVFSCFLAAALPFSPALAGATLPDAIDGALQRDEKHYLTLTVENDLFGGLGTDRNYTSGVRLGWFELGSKPPGLSKEVEAFLPFLETNATTSIFYSLGHNLFTPKAVGSPLQDPNDRPWAAFLYGSVGIATLKNSFVDEYELTLGVVGPLALGEEIQRTVHDIVHSVDPQGWDNQLENEPGFMFSWQRRWPRALYGDLRVASLALAPHTGVTLGNIYTYANGGVTLKLSSEHSKWHDKPLLVRPAIPGTGFFLPSKDVEWELFAGLEGRAMARNIFLDGNTFEDSHRVDKKPVVLDLSAGASLIWQRVRLSYTVVWRSKEFVGQDDPSLFAGFSLGYNF